jgi:hypothetical protein
MNTLIPLWIIIAPLALVLIDWIRTPKTDPLREMDAQVPRTVYTPTPPPLSR